MHKKLKNIIKYSLFAIPIPFLTISCSPNYEYEYIESSFTVSPFKKGQFKYSVSEHVSARELYLGDYDNPQLNVPINWNDINEFTIIDSANQWDYFLKTIISWYIKQNINIEIIDLLLYKKWKR